MVLCYIHISSTFIAQATIVNAPTNLAVGLRENATFTCIASGHPAPDILWFQTSNFDVNPIETESQISINDTITSTLLIHNVTESDFVNYSCMASNEFSTDRTNFTLSQAGELLQ